MRAGTTIVRPGYALYVHAFAAGTVSFHCHNSLPLNGTDHIEFYVGNARQASYFYRMAFGMRLVAYAGPETGTRDRASFVLQQGKIRFVLTTPLRPDNEMADHIHRHGDGVRDVALCVDDVRQAWREATRRGARSVREPFELKDSFGTVKLASIAAYGDTVHTFVERHNYCGVFLPGYREFNDDTLARSVGLTHVDHMVANVGWNGMNRWAKFYSDVLGFDLCQNLDARDMPTECSTPISKVMAGARLPSPSTSPEKAPSSPRSGNISSFTMAPASKGLHWLRTTFCIQSRRCVSVEWTF